MDTPNQEKQPRSPASNTSLGSAKTARVSKRKFGHLTDKDTLVSLSATRRRFTDVEVVENVTLYPDCPSVNLFKVTLSEINENTLHPSPAASVERLLQQNEASQENFSRVKVLLSEREKEVAELRSLEGQVAELQSLNDGLEKELADQRMFQEGLEINQKHDITNRDNKIQELEETTNRLKAEGMAHAKRNEEQAKKIAAQGERIKELQAQNMAQAKTIEAQAKTIEAQGERIKELEARSMEQAKTNKTLEEKINELFQKMGLQVTAGSFNREDSHSS